MMKIIFEVDSDTEEGKKMADTYYHAPDMRYALQEMHRYFTDNEGYEGMTTEQFTEILDRYGIIL